MITCDVAIVGAGPYGLSTAAHLKAANGLDIRVFGEPMGFWLETRTATPADWLAPLRSGEISYLGGLPGQHRKRHHFSTAVESVYRLWAVVSIPSRTRHRSPKN